MCDTDINGLAYGTLQSSQVHQAWNNQSCAMADGRPFAGPTGLCTSHAGQTGAEQLGVVGIACPRGGDLKSWRYTSSAAKQCTPTVPDAFNQGQQVPNPFYAYHGGQCTQRGYMACVDGLCVPGCARKACLPVPDAGCTQTCQFGTCQPEWWRRT